jgi:hypothetical protein
MVPVVVLTLTLTAEGPTARAQEAGEWIPLFDGRSLEGWRPNEGKISFKVEDNAIVCDGTRSHLFYSGPVNAGTFRNFELELEVRTSPGANSGVYFHTQYQESDWPAMGYEVQVNNTATGEGGYRENKKTGSLYGVRNVHKQIVPDDQWFTLRITTRGARVTIHVNDVQTVDYIEPEDPPTAGYSGRRISEGTFALQCHDPASRVAYRNIRVRVFPDHAGPERTVSQHRISPELARLHANNYPVIDLHTHLKGGLTLEQVLERQYRTGINAGIAVNCGLGFAITNDAGLHRALLELRSPLAYIGMQAEGREWTRLFSPEAIGRFDYVFTDAMTIRDHRDQRVRLWIADEVEINDPQAFMDMLVERTVEILENEPIDIWVNPTYLPDAIATDYVRLWTEARMNRVIHAACAKQIAIEINDRFRLPSVDFIRLAKRAGARFTLGTNNGGPEDLGSLDYCAEMIRACDLGWEDFWIPGGEPGEPANPLR